MVSSSICTAAGGRHRGYVLQGSVIVLWERFDFCKESPLPGRGRDWLDLSVFGNSVFLVFPFSPDHSSSHALEEFGFLGPGP